MARVVIDIPDEAYELLKSKSELDNIAESIIANGTPYEERPQGEWIFVAENELARSMDGEKLTTYKCPLCERMLITFPSKLTDYPFCHCGADLRGKEE